MTVILDGILNEIASSFVSLTPRNDGDLMRLLRFARNDGILGNSKIPRLKIVYFWL